MQPRCEEGSVVKSALIHTVRIFVFILLFTLLLNTLIAVMGEEELASLLNAVPVLGTMAAGLIGLIPNCAASVLISEMYMNSLISFGQMMAGLLVGAGVGLLVLFRSNNDIKENIRITAILYATGVLWGVLIDLVLNMVS